VGPHVTGREREVEESGKGERQRTIKTEEIFYKISKQLRENAGGGIETHAYT
jgi:hypothetical protein